MSYCHSLWIEGIQSHHNMTPTWQSISILRMVAGKVNPIGTIEARYGLAPNCRLLGTFKEATESKLVLVQALEDVPGCLSPFPRAKAVS